MDPQTFQMPHIRRRISDRSRFEWAIKCVCIPEWHTINTNIYRRIVKSMCNANIHSLLIANACRASWTFPPPPPDSQQTERNKNRNIFEMYMNDSNTYIYLLGAPKPLGFTSSKWKIQCPPTQTHTHTHIVFDLLAQLADDKIYKSREKSLSPKPDQREQREREKGRVWARTTAQSGVGWKMTWLGRRESRFEP